MKRRSQQAFPRCTYRLFNGHNRLPLISAKLFNNSIKRIKCWWPVPSLCSYYSGEWTRADDNTTTTRSVSRVHSDSHQSNWCGKTKARFVIPVPINAFIPRQIVPRAALRKTVYYSTARRRTLLGGQEGEIMAEWEDNLTWQHTGLQVGDVNKLTALYSKMFYKWQMTGD